MELIHLCELKLSLAASSPHNYGDVYQETNHLNLQMADIREETAPKQEETLDEMRATRVVNTNTLIAAAGDP